MNARRSSQAKLSWASLLMMSSMAGCAMTGGHQGSWIEPLTVKEARGLASEVTKLLQERVPPAKTLLVVEPAQRKARFEVELEAALHGAGYALALPNSEVQSGHRVRYRVSTLDGGILLRLELDDIEISRWYGLDEEGRLVAVTPFTIGESEQGLPLVEAGLAAEVKP